ncbi:aminoglycoside phosphotransferase family protein [Nonomuraea sp. NPDC049695]|uniref:phosphotransferase enzyme family protein n=1 Tax=Nonomuraea sp. NPDC049695 TaxID=3154734 RepID=UPI003442B3B9
MTADGQAASFTAAAAFHALQLACEQTGLNWSGATLIGPVGDNGVFRLPLEHVVARVAWGMPALATVKRELRVAEWLAEQDLPAVRPAVAVGDQPVLADDRPVTFWEEIPGPQQGRPADIGALLRHLHALPAPPDGMLPVFDPFYRQADHIHDAAGLHERDRRFLLDLLEELQAAYAGLHFAHEPRAIHGDPHRKNLVRAADSRTVMLDLERFAIGPIEWDLVVVANYHVVGWYTAAEYAAFVEAYGADITQWEGFDALAKVRQLRMTTWLASRTGREPRLIPEAHLRISTLRDGSAARAWTPGT